MVTLFIDPGALRTELSLEASDDAPDGAGGFSEGWIEVATVFGLIEPAVPSSRYGAGRLVEEQTHRITLRHRGDVEPGMRLRRGATAFEVLTVHDPDESGRYLVCRCKETAP